MMFPGGMPASAPWLSVIMPSYCGEAWIHTALSSLATEAVPGIEVLVIDSSPTPATRDIAGRFTERLDLRILEQPMTSWHTKTNVGVDAARSGHLCWLGVDDVWLPGRAAAVRSWIESCPEAPLHLAPSAIIDEDGRILGTWRCPLPSNTKLSWPLVTQRLLVQNFIAAPAPVFRRDAWLACGGLDEQLWYTADWDIWLKLAAAGPVYYHEAVTIGFRIHGGSLTVSGSRDPLAFAHQMQTVLDRHLARLRPGSKSIARAARTSIVVNTALALASSGDYRALPRAAWSVMRLGPAGIHRYLRDSRIIERVIPRMRAKLRKKF